MPALPLLQMPTLAKFQDTDPLIWEALTKAQGVINKAITAQNVAAAALAAAAALPAPRVLPGAGPNAVAPLGADVAISTVADTTILSQAITMPATGGPFRVAISWSMHLNVAGGATVTAFVSDGTNPFASSQWGTAAAGNYGMAGGQITSSTYGNGAAVTFTLLARGNFAATAKAAPFSSPNAQNSFLSLTVIPSA